MFKAGSRPYIIAEMSGNHNQSIERALAIIEAAAKTGANAIKLQTYTPDTLTIDHDKGLFFIEDSKSLWKGRTLYDLYAEAMTPWEWHQALFDKAKELNIDIFSSPFDETSVDFLETLNVPCYKIASFENNHFPLLRKVAQTKKPVIMSTGASTLQEITDAVEVLRENGCEELTLLKCTSTYPAEASNTNLLTIPELQKRFNCNVGLSDHTQGIGASIGAVALGATVIEKHFTLDRSEGGVDSAFSMEPDEFTTLVVECNRVYDALGEVFFGILPAEEKSLQYKRSIYATTDIEAGESLTTENVKVIRPSGGLHSRHWEEVLERKASKKIAKGDPISWENITE